MGVGRREKREETGKVNENRDERYCARREEESRLKDGGREREEGRRGEGWKEGGEREGRDEGRERGTSGGRK